MKTIFALTFSVLFIACRNEVDISYDDHQSLPVVNSILRGGDTLEVQVTLSSAMNNIEIENGDIADIEIILNDTFPIPLTYSHHGIYKSEHVVKENETFNFTIGVDNYDTISHRITIPPRVKITNVRNVQENWSTEEQDKYPTVFVEFENDPSELRYYEVCQKQIYSDEIKELIGVGEKTYVNFQNHTDPIILNESLPITLFSNRDINDERYELALNHMIGKSNGSFAVEFRSVTKDYYEYVKSLYLYDQGRYPFSLMTTPLQYQIHSNVENGYGIIAGYSTSLSNNVQ